MTIQIYNDNFIFDDTIPQSRCLYISTGATDGIIHTEYMNNALYYSREFRKVIFEDIFRYINKKQTRYVTKYNYTSLEISLFRAAIIQITEDTHAISIEEQLV